MMKSLTTLLFSSFTCAILAQVVTVPKCLSPQAIQYQESLTPGFSSHVDQLFEAAKQYGAQNEAKSGSIYTIPVVVHIVHNTPEQNLPDSVIFNQIAILNEDYNRLNADTVNMRADFEIVKGNPQIEFVLAQIDENGDPTTGITRTQTSTTSFGSLLLLSNDFSDLEKVKSTANGGHDPWDQTRYLNIWVCNMSIFGFTALLGYATPPAGLPNWPPGSVLGLSDGVVIQFQAFGSNNPNPLDAGGGPIDVRGRTSVHEVGHYLGLRHIWGDGDCTAQDGIDDTPNADAQSNSDCDITKNTCVDDILGFDLPDMVENYMDYSAETCQNSFTEKQVELMHAVLELQRYDLVHGNPAALDEPSTQTLALFPNPAHDDVHIASGNLIMHQLEVCTLSGQHVKGMEVNANTHLLETRDLEAGVYLIKATMNNGDTGVVRFVKN